MKRLMTLGLIVPLAMLVGFATVSMAADAPVKQELNQDLNKDLNSDTGRDAKSDDGVTKEVAPAVGDDVGQDNSELNSTNSRESSSIAAKRGRQPRRGSTSKVVADQQKYWGDNKSGKENNDEGDDEDENPDVTLPSN